MKAVEAFIISLCIAVESWTWFLLLFCDFVIFLGSMPFFWIFAYLSPLIGLADCCPFLAVDWVLNVVLVMFIWFIVIWLSC